MSCDTNALPLVSVGVMSHDTCGPHMQQGHTRLTTLPVAPAAPLQANPSGEWQWGPQQQLAQQQELEQQALLFLCSMVTQPVQPGDPLLALGSICELAKSGFWAPWLSLCMLATCVAANGDRWIYSRMLTLCSSLSIPSCGMNRQSCCVQ